MRTQLPGRPLSLCHFLDWMHRIYNIDINAWCSSIINPLPEKKERKTNNLFPYFDFSVTLKNFAQPIFLNIYLKRKMATIFLHSLLFVYRDESNGSDLFDMIFVCTAEPSRAFCQSRLRLRSWGKNMRVIDWLVCLRCGSVVVAALPNITIQSCWTPLALGRASNQSRAALFQPKNFVEVLRNSL